MKLVLASGSPRRARLLEEAGHDIRLAPPDVDESVPPGTAPEAVARMLAERKARAITAPGEIVLAADTLLDLDGIILGKPTDAADAVRILRALSGRSHRVLTGVCVMRDGDARVDVETTRVTFRTLSDAEVEAYVATGEPMDKAGAYGIQGGAAGFVAKIEGPVDNVIGLPMALVDRLLRAFDA